VFQAACPPGGGRARGRAAGPERAGPILVAVDNTPIRRVGSHLIIDVQQPAELILQVAVSGLPGATVQEDLTVTHDGQPQVPPETTIPGQGRVHVVPARPGRVMVSYQASVDGHARPPEVTEADRLTYLRPSRYAESDRLAAIARAEFGGISLADDLLAAVSSWVGTQLSYVPGSSGPTDGAVQTLLSRQGVCRDYAHLVIALLRALDVPARLAAVYAPGLDPMDFHAVAEALVDGAWRVVDATLLAPRSSLVRIATGRDAADTAFLSNYGGFVELVSIEVTAVTDGMLPGDDVISLASLG
jgi:transglutaminase-like putative cysteine protease